MPVNRWGPKFALILVPIIALLSVAQLLFLHGIPPTPNQDLARHVALALNFFDALAQGQFIPRLQAPPPNLPDLPVFQYYGFLSSAMAMPGLRFGLDPLDALIAGVAICRTIGLYAVFGASRKLGTSVEGALLACIAYSFFPYVQTNLYARAAIPEACAQGVLPLLILGWVMLLRDEAKQAVLLIAIAVILLALAHPIYLLWGTAALGFIAVAMLLRGQLRAMILLMSGLLIGLGLSAFQWYPALSSVHDLTAAFYGIVPSDRAFLTSLSGFYSLPSPTPAGDTPSVYYFTGAIWCFPVVAYALLTWARHRGIALERNFVPVAAGLFLGFFLLSFNFCGVWALVPHQANATQFPYRLLSFVDLFSIALLPSAICSVQKRWGRMGLTVLTMVIVLSAGKSLIAPGGDHVDRLQMDRAEIKRRFASLDYVVNGQNGLADGDGWLRPQNRIELPEASSMNGDLYLAFKGRRFEAIHSPGFTMRVVSADNEAHQIGSDIKVPEGFFEARILLPKGTGDVRLLASQYLRPSEADPGSIDDRDLSIALVYFGISKMEVSYIESKYVARTVISPYQRSFRIDGSATPTSKGPYVVYLPLAFSRFQTFMQGEQQVPATALFNGLTGVTVERIDLPIRSLYKIPGGAIALSIAGVFMAGVAIFLASTGFAMRGAYFGKRGS